jgi:peptide/nickel transport system permease protein
MGSRAARLRSAVRAFVRFSRASPVNMSATALVALVLFAALLGPWLAPHPPDAMSLTERLHPPSSAHPFGTDDYGRDLLSRVIAGARISIEVVLIVLSLSVGLGTILGAVAGLAGGLADEIIMRVTDLFLAFPVLILAAAIAATLGGNLTTTMIALAAVYWPWYARLVRGQVLSLREREYVFASRTFGASAWWIIRVHLLPNVMPFVIVQVSLDVGYVILATSSLSFLGLGAQAPTPEWGAMLTDARAFIRDDWWFATFPGMALATTVFGFNLLGDGLRDWLDPRLRSR